MNPTTPPVPPAHHHRLPWRMRLRSAWPLYVWLLAAVLVVPLVMRDSNWMLATRIHGIVGRETIVVTPEETARIQRLLVATGDVVTNGQPLVEMDTVSIDYQIAERLLDSYRTAFSIQDQRSDAASALSRQQELVVRLETSLSEERLNAAAASAELGRLREEQEMRARLFKEGLINEIELQRQAPRIAELEQTLQPRQDLIALLESRLARAHEQLAETEKTLEKTPRERKTSDDIQDMLHRIENDTERYRQSYTLRSPCNGVVSEVRREEGEVVRADMTVLRIVPESLSTVVALIPEQVSTTIQTGDTVWVNALNNPDTGRFHLQARVESLAEEVRVEAALLNIGGRMIPMRSRRAMLRLENPAESRLIAGEIVEIRKNMAPRSLLDRVRHFFTRSTPQP